MLRPCSIRSRPDCLRARQGDVGLRLPCGPGPDFGPADRRLGPNAPTASSSTRSWVTERDRALRDRQPTRARGRSARGPRFPRTGRRPELRSPFGRTARGKDLPARSVMAERIRRRPRPARRSGRRPKPHFCRPMLLTEIVDAVHPARAARFVATKGASIRRFVSVLFHRARRSLRTRGRDVPAARSGHGQLVRRRGFAAVWFPQTDVRRRVAAGRQPRLFGRRGAARVERPRCARRPVPTRPRRRGWQGSTKHRWPRTLLANAPRARRSRVRPWTGTWGSRPSSFLVPFTLGAQGAWLGPRPRRSIAGYGDRDRRHRDDLPA